MTSTTLSRFSTKPVSTKPDARALLAEARDLLANDEAAQVRIGAARERLDEPLRVALAGKIKAGKSTLLNAFLGERVAPTDTGECTQVVTWYRAGPIPGVTVFPRSGRPLPQPVRKVDGRLHLTTGGLKPADVERIEVRWPSPSLAALTLVDTPGLGSLTEELSQQSTSALTPDGSVSQVDAVVYLMRHLHATDADFLEAFRDSHSAPSRPAMTLAVLSRADEVGAGRIDSLLSAARVAQRYRTDQTVRSLCLDVVPVAGLLAESGRTLRQVEFEALRDLSGLSRDERESLLLSTERFVGTPLESCPAATPQVRSALLSRFGVFGIRLSTVLVRYGFDTATALADELVRRSGLDEVTRLLTVQFASRAEALKARSALLSLRQELRGRHGEAVEQLAERVDIALRSRHELDELQMLSTLRASPPPDLSPELLEQAEGLLGRSGTTPAERLQAVRRSTPGSPRDRAISAIATWRQAQSDPDITAATAEVCRVVIRSLEGIVAELGPTGQAAIAAASPGIPR
jgi:Dynamin family